MVGKPLCDFCKFCQFVLGRDENFGRQIFIFGCTHFYLGNLY
jgi:hypothetical protein